MNRNCGIEPMLCTRFRSNLPVVSNLTAMNMWDATCMFFIYTSFLEFVVMNYLARSLFLFVLLTATNQYRKFETNIPRKRTAPATVPISTFVCLWTIYKFPRSICLFCCRKYMDRSWEYINRSQTECGNWDWGHAIPRKGIHKWDFRCSAWDSAPLPQQMKCHSVSLRTQCTTLQQFCTFYPCRNFWSIWRKGKVYLVFIWWMQHVTRIR
jgi:hypothetical protein